MLLVVPLIVQQEVNSFPCGELIVARESVWSPSLLAHIRHLPKPFPTWVCLTTNLHMMEKYVLSLLENLQTASQAGN
jgi:hypothetical protein